MSPKQRQCLAAVITVLAIGAGFWAWRVHRRRPYETYLRERAAAPHGRIRARALRELAVLGGKKNAAVITSCLKTDPDGYVRAIAAECLGKLSGPEHVPVLGAALHDADPRVADAATRSLAEAGGDSAFNELVGAIDEGDEHRTVMIVATALPSFKTGASEDVLVQLLGSRSPWIRWRAVRSLITVGTKRCVPRLKELQPPENDPLAGTDYQSPQFKKHELRGVMGRLVTDAIAAASTRPPWPAGGEGGEP